MDSVLSVVIGYLVGSVPVGYLVASRATGVDLRRVGSRNVGAANAYRTAGLFTGVMVAAVDIAKGATSVLAAAGLSSGAGYPVSAGVAAIIGHAFPVWLRFSGGKGVATACGVFGVLAPLGTALAAALFVVIVWSTRYVSLGSMVASVALPPLLWLTAEPSAIVTGAGAAAAVILHRHRDNLYRLWRGTERRLT
jgi:acyl phosphate:glycerol-3-phosphate acyltransferase